LKQGCRSQHLLVARAEHLAAVHAYPELMMPIEWYLVEGTSHRLQLQHLI